MPQPEFDEYLKRLIPEYAADNVRAGYWDESEALERSRQQIKSLLPQVLQTKDHYIFFSVYDGDQKVGMIWLKANVDRPGRDGFIFDVIVDERFCGKGYGKQVMALEEKALELGLKSIGLHVFAYNTVAKKLYESVGYEVTSLNMVKKLD